METPRVLIVMRAQWPRALIRAALRDVGYDALGARDLDEAVSYPAEEDDRGRVRLIILDQGTIEGGDPGLLVELSERYGDFLTLLLESAVLPPVQGVWPNVLRHPVAIGDIVKATQRLVPIPSASVHPID